MTLDKKKKKPLLQVQEQEQVGSGEYLANREIDQIIKRGKDRLKHAITLSDEKLTKTKKQIVREMATEMEKAGYPVNQICDRLTKSLKGLVSERTVRELDAKYKDPAQSQVALAQNHDGGSLYRQQEQVRKKPVQEITLEDITQVDLSKTKLKQIAKHQMQKAEWWEQQVKQNKDKEQQQPVPTSIPDLQQKQQQQQDDKDKEITEETFTAECSIKLIEMVSEITEGFKMKDLTTKDLNKFRKSHENEYINLILEINPSQKTVKIVRTRKNDMTDLLRVADTMFGPGAGDIIKG